MVHTLLKILLRSTIIFFALWGFIEILKLLTLTIFKSKKDNFILILSPTTNEENEIEFTLRSMLSCVKWMGKTRPRRVILLDTGMNDSTRKMCKLICNEYEYPELMNKEELLSELDNINRSK